ncbi:hypothetical protein ACTQ45_10510 [Fundicoccus sp. Sow4_D5]|uniref:hypothetical protein n=1 Tax=Fundicoccus sp. Sow4_D5 TaxID=3438782 RepID=UPI003F932508
MTIDELMTLLNYVYNDGLMISEEVSYLESSTSFMSALNPDFEAQVKKVRSLVGEDFSTDATG